MATFVAIMQNASCGVRTWMACQLRFSTNTIVLFKMSDINLNGVMEFWRIGVLLTPSLHYSNTPCVHSVFDVVSLLVGLRERESVEGGKAIPRGSWSLNNQL